ncbi:Energy-dependent translational throttle protein EttA [bacterium HR39]|nr:Energy-dependent translational throttle protein EttA [bacterium HR39]
MNAVRYVFVMRHLTKAWPGGRRVLDDVTLAFLPGAKIGVVGHNGAGKSTLLRIMAGLDTDFSGEAWAADGIRVGLLEQEPRLDPERTVIEHVMDGVAEVKALLDRFTEVSMRFAEVADDVEMERLMAEQAELQEKIDAVDGWEIDRMVEMAMDALRCPPPDTPAGVLSGGEKRRVALCRLLLSRPDLLLLDEPTNHLDAESVAWLEQHLKTYPGTVVCVTHDRYFLDNVAGWILELDRGRAIPFEGNYSAWLEAKRRRLEQEAKEEQARRRTLEREAEWIRSTPQARRAKAKARIRAYEELLREARERPPQAAQIVIPPGPRLGDVVLEVEHLYKGYGDRLLIEDLSLRVPPGAIVGVIGPNGVGKTTLFRMIVGQERPDAGTIRLGETVVLGYVDQTRDALDPDRTVWEEITDGQDVIELGRHRVQGRAYVAAFNFRGADQQKKVGELSGGERNRVHLAKLLKSGANFLLLDEPTNDLDVDTLRALEDALLDFAGSVMVISHDRWFLDRICTHILAFEGDSRVTFFEGNFTEYEEDRVRRLGEEAARPHRVRYKPLRLPGTV